MQLGHWILIDEALIVAPMLCSLIVSWAIFFEQTSHDIPPERRFTEMKNYVGLRCRVYLLMVLIPIAIVVLIKDLWPLLSQLSPAFAGLVAVSAIIAMLLVMPLLVRLMWTNRPITEIEGRESLLQLCKNHGLAVKDIHVWDTNHQIVNALVAGLVPRFRILMVSDLLLHSFPQHELQAILRHEAGHIRLRHLQTRIGFILLPALAMLAIEMDPNQTFNNWAADFGITTSAGLLLGLVFFAYVIIVTTWLSRNMEFEADLYAIGAFQKNNSEIQTAQNASVMADALLRFAEQNPDQFSRRSITHPSLMERIEMIKKANNSTKVARDFQRRFGFCQFAIAFSILLVLVVLLAL
jgi:Zn-dependent protease with chaperone function